MTLPRSTWFMLPALILLLLTLFRPTWPMQQPVYRFLFVLDITQSMNARDYHHAELPPDRLSYAKAAVNQTLHELPCGSEISLGIFSTKNIILLFEPLELCEHFTVIDDVLQHIDWRMAWAGDSYVERGLYGSILEAVELPEKERPSVIFMSDGEQTATELHRPPLQRMRGKVSGIVVGVGGLTPVVIPKLDQTNQPTGEFWKNDEIAALVESQSQPRTRPAGIPIIADPASIFKSRLQELGLQEMATSSGLRYHRLQDPEQFIETLKAEELAEMRTVNQDIRGLLVFLALILLLLPYLPYLRQRLG